MAMAPSTNYSAVARGFHWLTAILVLAAFILSEGGPSSRIFSEANRFALTSHEFLGFSVFILTALRLIWRLFDTQPAPTPMAGWMRLTSNLVHWVLFVLLLAVPLAGILGSWFEGYPLYLYFTTIPSPFTVVAGASSKFMAIHPLLGDAIIWIAGAHAAAALYHHFFLKDDVLRAMTSGKAS